MSLEVLDCQKVTFSQHFKEKRISDVARIDSMIIFHLSVWWKAKFFVMCDVTFLLRLQGKFDIDHSYGSGRVKSQTRNSSFIMTPGRCWFFRKHGKQKTITPLSMLILINFPPQFSGQWKENFKKTEVSNIKWIVSWSMCSQFPRESPYTVATLNDNCSRVFAAEMTSEPNHSRNSLRQTKDLERQKIGRSTRLV